LTNNASLEVPGMELLRNQAVTFSNQRNFNYRRSNVDSNTGGRAGGREIQGHTISLMSASICR